MGGTTGRLLEAFLSLCRGTPEDQGNEIGQWKDCFDKPRLKSRNVIHGSFLAWRQSFSGRHTDMEENRFHSEVKSNTMSGQDLTIYFFIF